MHYLHSGSDDQTIKVWVTKLDQGAKDPKTFIKKVKNIVKSFFQSNEDKKSEANEKAFEKDHANEEIGTLNFFLYSITFQWTIQMKIMKKTNFNSSQSPIILLINIKKIQILFKTKHKF